MLEFTPVYIDMSVLECYKVRTCRPVFRVSTILLTYGLATLICLTWHSAFIKLNNVINHLIAAKTKLILQDYETSIRILTLLGCIIPKAEGIINHK